MGALGEAAPVGRLPLVVDRDQDGSGQADDRGVVGEDPHHVGAPLDLLVHPLQGISGGIFL